MLTNACIEQPNEHSSVYLIEMHIVDENLLSRAQFLVIKLHKNNGTHLHNLYNPKLIVQWTG